MLTLTYKERLIYLDYKLQKNSTYTVFTDFSRQTVERELEKALEVGESSAEEIEYLKSRLNVVNYLLLELEIEKENYLEEKEIISRDIKNKA